jgi:hypothetical protein
LVETILIGVPSIDGPPLKSSQAFGVAVNSTKGFFTFRPELHASCKHQLKNRFEIKLIKFNGFFWTLALEVSFSRGTEGITANV